MACRRRTRACMGLPLCLAGSILVCNYYYAQTLLPRTHLSVTYSNKETPQANISLPLVPGIPVHDLGASTNIHDINKVVKGGIPTPVVPGNISKKMSKSYRSLPYMTGSMESNKMNDDYNFCHRKEPLLGPYKYDNHTRNPCWFDDGVFRCLPYFYVAGFSKCGTSDLFYNIGRHPDVIFADCKEKHWFDYYRFVENMRFIQNFTNMLATATSVIKAELDKDGFSKSVTGDATPCYVWGSLNWPCYEGNEGLDEPRYTNADMIYRLNPKSKVIVMFREPVSRLYSRMLTWTGSDLHPVYVNASPETFHDFIAERIDMYRDCFTRWSVRQCAYNGTLYKEAVLRLMEGVYSVYLRDWMKVFPREQLLFIKFEDYVTNRAQILKNVHSFLELAPLGEDTMHNITNAGIVNKGIHYNVGPMLNETRDILREFYRPFNEELSRLLHDPNFTWDYTK